MTVRSLAPASWSRDGVAIDARAQTTLFVSQTEAVHDRIALLIKLLHE
jgi:hypothetical protein